MFWRKNNNQQQGPRGVSRVRAMMSPRQRNEVDEQDRQIDEAQPLPSGGLPVYVLLLIGIVLAVSNAYLFITTIGGWYGAVIAAGAVTLETVAIWSILNARRTSEEHEEVLKRWGKILGTFSLTHCVCAIVHFSGYLPDNPVLSFYSHAVAFPLIIVLVWFACQEIIDKHWASGLFHGLITNKITALKHLGSARTEQQILLVAAQVEEVKADVFKIKTMIRQGLIPVLQERAETEAQIEETLRAIPNARVEDQIRAELDAITRPPQLNP